MKSLALVIENDAATRKLLDVLLSRVGMEVDLVATGTDAIIVLQNVRYDVVLVDLLLPGRTGFDILAWLADSQPDMLSRAVVLSSAPPSQLSIVAERWPQVRVVRKPFELGEVIEVVQRITAARCERELSSLEKFCRRSVRAGAQAGVVVTLHGSSVDPILSFGYTPEMMAAFPLTLDSPYPLTATLRHRKPLWIASLVMAAPEYPMLAPVFEKNECRALATIPLIENGHLLGAVGWSFREPRLFSDVEQSAFFGIAGAIPEWLDLRPEPSETPQARSIG